MSLTTSQLATLKTDIATNQSANLAARAIDAIAAYYNGAATGTIWRADIALSEIAGAVVGTEFIALTAGQIGLFQLMTGPGIVDASKANVRADFAAIFGAASTTYANLTALAKRTPTVLENLFTTAQVSAVFGYRLTRDDVIAAALNLDGTPK